MANSNVISTVQLNPRIAELRQKLQNTENALMGMSGREALAEAERAQMLQQKIDSLKSAQLAPRGNLAAFETLAIVHPRGNPGDRPHVYQPVAAGGHYRTKQAEDLARNLAKAHQHEQHMMQENAPHVGIQRPAHVAPRKQMSKRISKKVNPWSVIPNKKVLHYARKSQYMGQSFDHAEGFDSGSDKDILARGLSILSQGTKRASAPGGFVQVKTLLPGQKLPKGARVLTAEQVRLLRERSLPLHASAKHTMLNRVMLDDVEGEDSSNTTAPSEPEVGDTGMTAAQLDAFANAEASKAKFLLNQAKTERRNAYDELKESSNMISRGWDKHQKGEKFLEIAEQHMQNSTALLNSFKMNLASGRAEREKEFSDKLKNISEALEAEASEKHGLYETALQEAGDLKLTSASQNSTETEAEA
ncbi:hypothetical protein GUITHDRAFT_99895 [Guillardia theta CCMP2712]|uniref:Uncharacterized protein n=2 Tax=Guillardia theta TaxID=55529 RepID=L1K1T3_GUITC|nr:hypothetical protein GUITHDRAFT_99895 [Guillardia theta CCMP2712]EKX54415.1 hypothetical protein GUITHDRAFT_99895 [Guillardia theta CCMP2712]|eukprot:XP_005841395.1 hypothetical protein GUITHDRAFT_99895 [Guillardia theta CCMP2712]